MNTQLTFPVHPVLPASPGCFTLASISSKLRFLTVNAKIAEKVTILPSTSIPSCRSHLPSSGVDNVVSIIAYFVNRWAFALSEGKKSYFERAHVVLSIHSACQGAFGHLARTMLVLAPIWRIASHGPFPWTQLPSASTVLLLARKHPCETKVATVCSLKVFASLVQVALGAFEGISRMLLKGFMTCGAPCHFHKLPQRTSL